MHDGFGRPWFHMFSGLLGLQTIVLNAEHGVSCHLNPFPELFKERKQERKNETIPSTAVF